MSSGQTSRTSARIEARCEILKKITTRWEKVLDLIIKDNGGNDLVESERGLTSSISDQIESDSDSENELEDIEENVREVSNKPINY